MTPKTTVIPVRLASDEYEVTVLPEAGGRVISVRHAGLGRELLWQNPSIAPA